jgi:hypothetical protein
MRATRCRCTRSSNAASASRSPPAACGPATSSRPSASLPSPKVYSHLERAGALETRRGVGTFIADARVATLAVHERARSAELRAIATRALADASARGFTAAQLRRELLALSRGAS